MKKLKFLVATLLVGILSLGLVACGGGLTSDTNIAEVKSQKVNDEQWIEAWKEYNSTFFYEENYTVKMTMSTEIKVDGVVGMVADNSFVIKRAENNLHSVIEEKRTYTGEDPTTDKEETFIASGDGVFTYTYSETDEKWYKEHISSNHNEYLDAVENTVENFVVTEYVWNFFQFQYDDATGAYVAKTKEIYKGNDIIESETVSVKIVDGKVAYFTAVTMKVNDATTTTTTGSIIIYDIGTTTVTLPHAEFKAAE